MLEGLKDSKYRNAAFFLIAANSALWSVLAVLKYDAFNAQVADLGIASSLLYGVFHPAFSGGIIHINKLIYLIMAPFYNLYPDPRVLLVFQSIWLSLGAYPIYRISSIKLRSGSAAMLLSISYLIYFPLGGVYWYDFHYMALFPTLFLFTFMFYLQGNRKLFLIFIALSAVTDFLAPLIIAFFLVFLYFDWKNHPENREFNRKYIIAIAILATAIFVAVNVYYGYSYTLRWMNYPFSAHFFSDLSSNVPLKLEYFAMLLIPVAFLSLLEPALFIMILPYFLLAFAYNYPPYFTPYSFQYPALTAPIIFISLIFGIERLLRRKKGTSKKLTARNISILLLAIGILTAGAYSPVGNLVTGSHFPYDTRTAITVTHQDLVLKEMISEIPKGSTVLIQGNMPQLTNGYHWLLPFQVNMSNPPEYAVSDPYNYFYNHSVLYSTAAPTFEAVFNSLLNSGQYMVVSSSEGIQLIERV